MGRLLGKFFGASYLQEVPSGTVNGTNTAFTLSQTPPFVAAVLIFLDGALQTQGTDYTISGTTVTMSTAPAVGQNIAAFYLKQS